MNIHVAISNWLANGSIFPFPHKITETLIVSTVCEFFNVSHEDVIGMSRKREYIHPRQVMCFLLDKLLNITHGQIAKIIRKDRTTVIHSLRVIRKEIGIYENRKEIDDLILKIKINA